MKRRLAALLVLVMVFATCFTSLAETNMVQRYSTKWTPTSQGKWMVLKNNAQQRSTWILDDESDSAEGYYYLLDEDGYMVTDQLVVDGMGNYYSFNDQHDGHYGALRTKNGVYNGIELNFSPNHDGTFGAITNKDGIAKLKAAYGLRDLSYITNAKIVKMSDVKYSNAIIDDTPYEKLVHQVSYDLDGITVTEPDRFTSYKADFGTEIKKPATPSDAVGDAIFEGWYAEDHYTKYDFAKETYYLEGDTILWAKWFRPNYLTFTAEEDSTLKFKWKSGSDVQVRYGGSEEWVDYAAGTLITMSAGSSVKFKGKNVVTDYDNRFVMTGKIAASGSVTSLTDGNGNDPDVKLAESCYKGMFYGCKSLTSAPELPATTLAKGCYTYMFGNCTALTSAPELPAETLADYCYSDMFYSCTSLTSAPALPAETLKMGCYYDMFVYCTALTEAPALPATTLAKYCYRFMFYSCTSLTSAPALPAETLAYGCYYGMFQGCTSLTSASSISARTLAEGSCYSMFQGCTALTNAPEFSAETLAGSCCTRMFEDCTSLTSAPELPAETLADFCYSSMFYGCTALTGAPELPAETLADFCYSNMFSGCTALTNAPELPAETLAKSCYSGMFSGCTALTGAPELPAETLAESCYFAMFYGDTALTNAPELPATTLATYCYFSMFEGCTSLTSAPALPAETLTQECYRYMFQNCTSLTSVGTISGKTFDLDSCSWMFRGCTGMTVQEGSGDGLIIAVPSTVNVGWSMYDMFANTKGGIYTPTAGKSYYYSTTPPPM